MKYGIFLGRESDKIPHAVQRVPHIFPFHAFIPEGQNGFR